MRQDEICARLIASTIHVVSTEGLDKATTKLISIRSDINEASIYRVFENKEDLLNKTFASLDSELVAKIMEYIHIMYDCSLSFEERCRQFFSPVWRFLLSNEEKCRAFIRYYYSPYFKKYSLEAHRIKYIPVVKKFEDAFRAESNIWMLLNHILNVMLDFAVKVFNHEVSDSDDTAEHVFLLIYTSVITYKKV